MKIQNDQQGRTMLEMLGVLAIMGIITYGAIAGINYGMTSYKINQTYTEVQDIIQGVQDLYSWSKGFPIGVADSTNQYSGCPKVYAAACENDVLQNCSTNAGADGCTAHGAFGRITVFIDNGNLRVKVPIADGDNRERVEKMDWKLVNINVTCNTDDCQESCCFTPQ